MNDVDMAPHVGHRRGMSRTAGGRARHLTASGRELAATARQIAPAHLIAYVAAMAAEALVPVVAAWLTKLIIDSLAGVGAGTAVMPDVVWLASALAAAGVAIAVLPQATGYLGSEIGRRVVLDTTDRLFAAVTRLPGLRPFEDPHFLDRLRMVQEGSALGGSTVVEVFGSGGFLRARMMDHLRTASSTRRRMDRRELSIEGLLAVLGAVVAGGG